MFLAQGNGEAAFWPLAIAALVGWTLVREGADAQPWTGDAFISHLRVELLLFGLFTLGLFVAGGLILAGVLDVEGSRWVVGVAVIIGACGGTLALVKGFAYLHGIRTEQHDSPCDRSGSTPER